MARPPLTKSRLPGRLVAEQDKWSDVKRMIFALTERLDASDEKVAKLEHRVAKLEATKPQPQRRRRKAA